MSKPTLYQHLKEMGRKGWIEKDEKDHYVLTQEGKKVLKGQLVEKRAEEETRKLITKLEGIKISNFDTSEGEKDLQIRISVHFKDKESLDLAVRLLKSWPEGIFLLPLLKGSEDKK